MSGVATLTAVAGLVPDGPLHPGLAAAGIVLGIAAAVVAGSSSRVWTALVLAGAFALVSGVLGEWPTAAFEGRPVAIGLTLVALTAGWILRARRSTVTVVTVGACAGVWAIVPDTESALLSGAVVLGAGLVTLLPGWIDDGRDRLHGMLLVLPVTAAVIGSVGRTSRFEPALVVGLFSGLAALGAWQLVRELWRRQRAGMPTTVAPAGTSSTTTAPAPTTAS